MNKKSNSTLVDIKPKTLQKSDIVIPERKGHSLIERSEHFFEYDSWVKCGRSTRFCSQKALELFNEEISHNSFALYARKIPPTEFISNNILRQKLQEVSFLIDGLYELDVLIELAKKRLDDGMKFEDKAPMPLAINNEIFRIMHDLLKTKLTLEGRLKEMPQSAVAVSNNISFDTRVKEGDNESNERFISRMEEVAGKLRAQLKIPKGDKTIEE